MDPLPAINSEAGNESTEARNDLQRSQRSVGIPWLWRGEVNEGVGQAGWPAGWLWWDLSCQGCPWQTWAHHGFQPRPFCQSACLLPHTHTHADASQCLLMAFPGSSWQHSHYLWARGPLQRLLMQPLKLSSLWISLLALIKSEASQNCKWCACFNLNIGGCVDWQMRPLKLNLFPRGIDFILILSSSPSDVV